MDKSFEERYSYIANDLIKFDLKKEHNFLIESPSNIALIKYWGKYGDQLPQNPSLSFTLQQSKTKTEIVYSKASGMRKLKYYFQGERNLIIEKKVMSFFEKASEYQPFIKKLNFIIKSKNTFPHSAGIASSASAFSALAVGLCNIENQLFGTLKKREDFIKKASFLARLGSGSASRSINGSAVLWGKTELISESSNEVAVTIDEQVNHVFKSYYDAILIVSSEKKSLSSTEGHALMQNHPFEKARYKQANVNLERLLLALKSGGEKLFTEIVEHEAMSLHALLLSSNPSVNLLKPNTLAIISKLRTFRAENNIDFAFTLDAGPNIHVLYPQKIRKQILTFIDKQLKVFCEDEQWIDDKISERYQPKIL